MQAKKTASFMQRVFGFFNSEPTANDIMKRLGRELSGEKVLSAPDRARLVRALEVIQFSHEKLAKEHQVVRDLHVRFRQLGFGDKRRVEELLRFLQFGKGACESLQLSAVRRILA